MPAHMVLIRDEAVRDPEAMAEYQRINRENAGKFKTGMKPLVVYGAAEAVEGDPLYQDTLPYRHKAADYRAIIVEGI